MKMAGEMWKKEETVTWMITNKESNNFQLFKLEGNEGRATSAGQTCDVQPCRLWCVHFYLFIRVVSLNVHLFFLIIWIYRSKWDDSKAETWRLMYDMFKYRHSKGITMKLLFWGGANVGWLGVLFFLPMALDPFRHEALFYCSYLNEIWCSDGAVWRRMLRILNC